MLSKESNKGIRYHPHEKEIKNQNLLVRLTRSNAMPHTQGKFGTI